MKYAKLKDIKRLYFGYEELSKALEISLPSAKVSAHRYVKNGFLIRVKRNLYVLRDRWDMLSKEERYILANMAEVPSYISLFTALGYYEVTTQIQRDVVESISVKRTKEVVVDDLLFIYSKINRNLYFGFSKIGGYFMASPEKAFLDSVYLNSLKKYSFDHSSIDINKLDIKKLKAESKKFPSRTREALKKWKI